jgi:hypothetical protein
MGAETTHRGVEWRRNDDGSLEFYDTDGGRWVTWAPGVDAPPVPPEWAPKRPARAGWKTKWRWIPIAIVVVAVVIAVVQILHPAGNQTAKENSAAQAMLGKCLSRHGEYLSTVSCTSPNAAFKVVKVVSTAPGSPSCPNGTTAVMLAVFSGVKYPHHECIQPLHP